MKTTQQTQDSPAFRFSDEDINTILAALVMAKTRYDTTDNGGIIYDFAFSSEADQNSYAKSFEKVEKKIRLLLPAHD